MEEDMIKRESLLSKYVHITTVITFYWIISISTVFINKTLLGSQVVNLDAPLFVTWYQCIVSSVICFCLSNLSKVFPAIIKFPEGNPLDVDTMRKVIPLSFLFIGMITFNNLCLKHVGVAFYTVGRSLTTVFNVVLTYVLLGQKTSFQSIVCCGIIVGGFWLGVNEENVTGSLSVIGVIFGVLGSLCLSLYSIFTKRVLPTVNNQIWLLSYFLNVYSSVLFLPLILINKEVSAIINYDGLFTLTFWSLMTIGGLCGLAIGYATALQIQVTSPLTHNISGTAKACAQTVLATFIYSEHKSWLWWLSNWLVLGGSVAYTRVKQLEMKVAYKQIKAEI